jgi:hypothetical protein
MTSGHPAQAGNIISGGTFHAPIIQAGRDAHSTFQLPAAVPLALAQLPSAAAVFTGRAEDLAMLARLLDPAAESGAVLVSAVAGLAGVGKTTLAVHAAHAAIRDGWFSGGVLFIDLHGYDETRVEPSQALDALLRALGVPAEHIPPTVEERAGLYRSALTKVGDPVLVIADNASSEAQVSPLLPGTARHKVLVTSRHTLAGVGARLVDITTLSTAASIELLDQAVRAARPDNHRITADPESAAWLAEACGGLPLALQITAALLVADPALTPADLAGQLADESQRLATLQYEDGSGAKAPSVAAAFSLSYNKLDDTAARVFRLLTCSPGPDISAEAAAALAGQPATQVRAVLGGLTRAHLIEPAPGTTGRWRMHDLVRLYTRQQGDDRAEADRRHEATNRLFSYWLDTVKAADDHLRALPGDAVPAAFSGPEQALAWLDAERASLIPAVQLAASSGRDQAALRLPLRLAQYLNWRRRTDDWITITAVSLETARRLGDQGNEAVALTGLGFALQQMRRYAEVITVCQNAIAIYRETGDRQR